jgi:hypothetical protein
MFAWFGQEVEALIGPISTIFLFLATGVVGWFTTAVSLRVRYPEDSWEIAKFQTGIGSSPATYGFGAFLSAVNPCSCALSAFGLSAWVWLPALVCVPRLFETKYGVQLQLKGGLKGNLRSLAFIATSCCVVYFLLRPLLQQDNCMVDASSAFALYLLYTIALKAFDSHFLGKSFWIPGSDNTAHFGGSLAGAVIGFCYAALHNIIDQQRISNCDLHSRSLILNTCLVYLAIVCIPQA